MLGLAPCVRCERRNRSRADTSRPADPQHRRTQAVHALGAGPHNPRRRTDRQASQLTLRRRTRCCRSAAGTGLIVVRHAYIGISRSNPRASTGVGGLLTEKPVSSVISLFISGRAPMNAANPVPPRKATKVEWAATSLRPVLSKVVKWFRRHRSTAVFLMVTVLLTLLALYLLPSDTPTSAPGAFSISNLVSNEPIKGIVIFVAPDGTYRYRVIIAVATRRPRNKRKGLEVSAMLNLPQFVSAVGCRLPNCGTTFPSLTREPFGESVALRAKGHAPLPLEFDAIGGSPTFTENLWGAFLVRQHPFGS
jgi:hypothetical protein